MPRSTLVRWLAHTERFWDAVLRRRSSTPRRALHTLESLEDRVVMDARPKPLPMLFAGAGAGSAPLVRVYDGDTGATAFTVTAYEAGFTGGVNVAAVDLNADTVPDLITGPGAGGGPRVRVFDGKTGEELAGPIGNFWAFDESFTGGVTVATADVTGDGLPDVVAAVASGGEPRVRVFDGVSGDLVADFLAFDASFTGGVNMAAADLTFDGKAEVIVGAGAGGGPHVKAFDLSSGTPVVARGFFTNFLADDPAARDGATVAVSDVNGDQIPDVVVGTAAGASGRVKVFNGFDGSTMSDFDAFPGGVSGGVRVAGFYLTPDRYADVVTASGDGRVAVFNAGTGQLVPGPLAGLTPFAGGPLAGVAAANDPGFGSVSMTATSSSAAPVAGQHFVVDVTLTGMVKGGTPASPTGTIIVYRNSAGTSTVAFGPVAVTPTGTAGVSSAQILIPGLGESGTPCGLSFVYSGDSSYLALTPYSPLISFSSVPASGVQPTPPCPCDDTLTQADPDASSGARTAGGVRVADGSFGLTGGIRPAQPSIDPGIMLDVPFAGNIDPGIIADVEDIPGYIGDPGILAGGTAGPKSPLGWGMGAGWEYSTAPGVAGPAAGDGGMAGQAPHLVQVNGDDSIAVVCGACGPSIFDFYNGTYHDRYNGGATLTAAGGQFILTDAGGNAWAFSDFSSGTPAGQEGQMTAVTTAAGIVSTVSVWAGTGKQKEVVRVIDGVTQSLLSTYVATGPNAGLLDTLTLRQKVGSGSWQTVRTVEYAYYTNSDANGRATQLKSMTLKGAGGVVLDADYYRYYVPSSGTGLLKYAFGPAAYARLTAALGTSVDALTDAQVDDYADHYLAYDSAGRVATHTVAGEGCSACSGGQGTYTYTYDTNVVGGVTIQGGTNVWTTKVVETLPDGNTNTYYANGTGQLMLKVYTDAATTDEWCWYTKYDAAGRTVLTAGPAGVTGYDEAYADLVNDQGGNCQYLADAAGLFATAAYGTSTTATGSTAGDVVGRLKDTAIRQGELGGAVPQAAETYIARTDAGGVTSYFPASLTTYRNDDGTGGQTTTVAYTWQGSTAAVETVTVTLPAVTTAQNGPNATTAVATAFDATGRPAWRQDAAGFLTYVAYDPLTGVPTKVITDVDTTQTADFTGLPSGWSTPSSGGLHLISTYEADDLGRVTKSTSPAGRVDYAVYDDAAHAVRYYAGWDAATDTPTGPTTVVRDDRAGGYAELLTMSASPAVSAGRPTGAEAVSGVQSLSRAYRNEAGQVTHTDGYFDLTGVTYSAAANLGTLGTNYDRVTAGYGKQFGQVNRQVSAAGTVTRTEYDGLGRAVSVWVGTDDVPATGFWSTTNLTGTDMVEVAAYEYDGGGVGDGDLTTVTQFPGGGAADRVTEMSYDWRGRLVAVKEGVESTEATGVNRPITYYAYDNLDEVTETATYDGDGVTVADADSDGVPDAPSASLLRSKTVAHYDERGRVYRLDAYRVDQATGAAATTPVTTAAWYGPRGEAAKVVSPGGLVQKTVYDGAGQPVAVYETDGGGDTGYADALTVTGDEVLAQAELAYDADGYLIQTTTRDRADGATGTGPLGTPTTGVAARVAHAGSVYDLGGRLVADVDVGTNGGTAWTVPTSTPTRSDTVLVTTYGYGADGLPVEVVGPDGVADRAAYDALGRTTSETAAYGTANAFTTTYAYAAGRLASVTAPGGRTTAYGYNAFEQVNAVTERAGTALERITAVVYNRLGDVVGTTDPLGTESAVDYDAVGRAVGSTAAVGLAVERTTAATYDALGRVLTVTDPRGKVTATAYDDIGRTVTTTDPLGNSMTFGYDAEGRAVTLTDAYGKTWTTAYDLQGRVTAVTDPLSHATTYAYLVGGDSMTVTDPLSHTTTATLDQFGRTAAVADALSNTATFAYDRADRVVTATDPRGTETDYAYDALGRTTGVTEAVGEAEERTTTYAFSSAGDLTDVTNARGYLTHYGYDTAGRVTGVTAAYGTADALTTGYGYDLLDRQTQVTRPGGRVSTADYDALGQLTTATNGVGTSLERDTAYVYDAAGNLVTVTDPLGHATTYGYDDRNQRTTITDALSGDTTLAYDKVGRLVSLTDPVGNETTWAYDDAGRLTTRTDPLGKATAYAYDAADNVTSVTDRTGRVRAFTYDADNRVTAETWKTALGATVQTQTFSYDADGNLLTATDPDGSYTLTYDKLNQVATADGPFGVSLSFTYDADGNRLTATDSLGGVQTSTYDALDRLATRELGGTGVTPMKAEWAYDATGDVGTLTRSGKSGSAWATAGVTTFTHDDLGRTTDIRLADASNTTLTDYGYSYDAADRVTAMDVNGTTRTYAYDATNQLTDDDGTAFTYDANGNRTTTGSATGAGNRLTTDGTWTYGYDDEGNVTSKASAAGTWAYAYDWNNQMTSAAYTPTGGSVTVNVAYKYDAFGNRIERDATAGSTTTVEKYVVDGWDTAKPGAVGTENFDTAIDLDGSGAVTARRVFGAGFDDLVGVQDGAGAVSWYGADALGSVRAVFDNSGAVTNTVDYDAFGGFLGGVPVDRYAFTGREWDAAAGLQYSRGRMYDSETGHWTSEDPIGFSAGDPNLSRYVGNSPTSRRDASGLVWSPEGVLALVGATNPYIRQFLIEKRAMFSSNGSTNPRGPYAYWDTGSDSFGSVGTRPDINLRADYSDQEAAAAVLAQFQAGFIFRGGAYNAAFKDWLLGLQNSQTISSTDAYNAQNAYNSQMLGDIARVALGGAELVLSVATLSPGFAAADFLIRATEGEIVITDALSALPYVGHLLGKAAGKIHIQDKFGKVHTFEAKKLKELQKELQAKQKKAIQNAGQCEVVGVAPKSPKTGKPNPFLGMSKAEVESAKKKYEKLIQGHKDKLEKFKQDPIGNSDADWLKEATRDSPTQEELRRRALGRVPVLENQIKKQEGELEKINEALEILK